MKDESKNESCAHTRLVVFDALKGIFVRLSSTLKLGKAQTDCRECVELKNDLFWAIFRLWQEK